MHSRPGISLVAFSLIVLCPLVEAAEQDPLRAVADKAMDKLKGNDLPAVLDVLQSYGKWTDDQRTDALDGWKKRRDKSAEVIGKPIGEIEFLKREAVGTTFVRFTYLEKWEKHALVWRLIFYKPKDEWILQGIAWDESVQPLFESAK